MPALELKNWSRAQFFAPTNIAQILTILFYSFAIFMQTGRTLSFGSTVTRMAAFQSLCTNDRSSLETFFFVATVFDDTYWVGDVLF